MRDQRAREGGPVGGVRLLAQIGAVAAVDAADRKAVGHGFKRNGIGGAKRRMLDQPRDDLDALDLLQRGERARCTEG
ncbi:hypothetical protein ABG067_009074, partial [Albugo candida]